MSYIKDLQDAITEDTKQIIITKNYYKLMFMEDKKKMNKLIDKYNFKVVPDINLENYPLELYEEGFMVMKNVQE